jgi:hypothetical protein
MAASAANQRGNAIDRCSSVEADCVLDEEDSKPSMVTSSGLLSSSPAKEVVQEEAPGQIPSGWRVLFAF